MGGRSDKISGVVLFLFFGAAFLYARSFPPLAATYVFIVNSLGMFLAALLLASSFIKDYKKQKHDSAEKLSKQGWVRIAVTFAATVLYVIVMRIISFVPATIIFGTGMILYLYLGRKSIRYCIISAVIAVSVALILFFTFGRLLFIPLP